MLEDYDSAQEQEYHVYSRSSITISWWMNGQKSKWTSSDALIKYTNVELMQLIYGYSNSSS